MVGGHRLLMDKGARGVVAAMTAVVALLALDRIRSGPSSVVSGPGASLRVQVFCAGRGSRLASAELRPTLDQPPARVGRPYARALADAGGNLVLPLPNPLPPGFEAELILAAPGCVSHRRVVGAAPSDLRITLEATTTAPVADPVADAPDAPAFPPPLDDARLALLREHKTYAPPDEQMWDGPAPSCGQCHTQDAREHASVHGRPTSAPLREALAAQPAGRLPACLACHAPTGHALGEAVMGCRVCHVVADEALTAGAGIPTGSAVVDPPRAERRPFARGVRGLTASPAMAVEHAPSLAGASLCAACHAQRSAVAPQLWVDPTVEEWMGWQQLDHRRSDTSCVTCHHPATADAALVEGAAHGMWGVDRPAEPRHAHARAGARGDSVVWEVLGGQLKVRNAHAGHAVPGAWPLRAWVLEVLDGAGKPLLQDTWRRALGNGQGGGCAVPWEATEVVADTRLMPGVERAWPLPAGAVRLRLSERGACGRTGDTVLWDVPLLAGEKSGAGGNP
jgi:hypothetical protein